MRKRHQLHRYEIKANIGGLGTHFFKHAEEMKINMNINMEEIMQHFKLFIITSTNKCSTDVTRCFKTKCYFSENQFANGQCYTPSARKI